MCVPIICTRCDKQVHILCSIAKGGSDSIRSPGCCENIVGFQDIGKEVCYNCECLGDVGDILRFWIGKCAGPRLKSDGGPDSGDEVEIDDDQLEAIRTARLDGGSSDEEEPVTEESIRADNEEYAAFIDLYGPINHRPLSGSTLASTGTAQTVSGPGTASLRNSVEFNLPSPSDDDTPSQGPATAQETQSDDKTDDTQAGDTNEPSHHPDDDLPPLLKRTISVLDFATLTPEIRTAMPPAEAGPVPPAYARPRSEVGLPPEVTAAEIDYDENSDVRRWERGEFNTPEESDEPETYSREEAAEYLVEARRRLMDGAPPGLVRGVIGEGVSE